MADLLDDRQSFSPVPKPDAPEWMNEYFNQINQYLSNLETLIIEPIHVEPFRKYDGLTVFADGTDWNPGHGRGVYYWDSNEGASGEWVYPLPTSDALNLFPLRGYGGVFLSAASAAMADIGAGWVTIPADAGAILTPSGVNQDFANDGLDLGYEGVWQVSIFFAIEHNEVPSSREMNVRVFNVTQGLPVASDIEAFTGRNAAGTNFSITALIEISNADVGDTLVIQVGGTVSVYTTVTLQSYSFSVNHLSNALSLAP